MATSSTNLSIPYDQYQDLIKDKENLEKQIRDVKRSLATESKERDILEKEAFDLERKAKQYERKINTLEQDLKRESSERDILDSENATLVKETRRLEQEIKNLKLQSNLVDEELSRLKDTKQRLTKRIDEVQKESDNEIEKLKEDLRAAKREVREKAKKFELEKENLEKELKRVQNNKRQTAQITQLETDLKAAEEKIKLLRSASTGTSTGKIDESVVNDLIQEKSKLIVTRDKAVADLEKLQEQVDRFQKDKESWETTKKSLESELKQLKASIENDKKQKDVASKSTSVLEEEINQLKAHTKELLENQQIQTEKHENMVNELRSIIQVEIDSKQKLQLDNDDLEDEIANLRVELGESLQNYTRSEAERGKLQLEINHLKKQVQDEIRTSQNKATSANAAVAEQALNKLESEVTSLKDQLAKEKKLKENYLAQLEKVKDSQTTIDTLNSQVKSLTEAKNKTDSQFDQVNSQLEKDKAKFLTQIEELNAKVKPLQSQLEEEKDAKKNLEKENSQLEKKTHSLESEISSLKLKTESQQKEISNLENQILATKHKLETETNEASKLKRSIAQLEQDNKQIETLTAYKAEHEKERKKMESDLADLRNKLEAEKQSREKAIRAEENALKQLSELKSQLESQTKSASSTNESRNKETEAKILQLQIDLEDAHEETKRLNNIKRRFEDEIEELKEEIEEEKEVADNALFAKRELEKSKTELEDKLDIEIQRRQEEAKQKQQILQEKETIQASLQDLKKNVEREKSELQSKWEQERSEKVAVEKKLSAAQKEVEEVKKTKDSLDSEISQLKSQLETLKKQAQNQTADRELAQLKSQLESSAKDVAKLKEQLSAKDQDIKNLQKPAPSNQFEEENKNLRAELEALKRQLAEQPQVEEDDTPTSTVSTQPRLSVPRRVAPARSGRRPPSSTIGVPQSPAEEEEPTTPVKKPINVAAMGGVNLFGGAGLTPDMLSKSKALTPASPQGPISDTAPKNRLWCVKGRRRVRSFQVEVSHKSLNKGDVFVLDTPKAIYQWNGSECNRLERTKGKDITSRILRQRTSFGAKPDVVTIDEGDNEDENTFAFWKEMGGKGPFGESKDDLDVENYLDSINKLYRVLDSGDLDPIEGKLVIEMLSSDSSYILDAKNEMYVWIGKNAKREVRSIAVTKAQELLESDPERATWTEIYKYPEGGEAVFFCEKFGNWPDGATLGPQKFSSNVAKSKAQEKIDVTKMVTVEPPIGGNIVKETDGVTEIWIVNEAVKDEQPSDLFGQFWTENSYVVLYTYGPPEDSSYLIYYWLGRKCNKNEKGTCAALALNLSKKLKGATQVRVPQGKEPKQFLQLFKGAFVVHQGNQNSRDESTSSLNIYCVKGGKEEGEAISVQISNNLLNSNHSFIFSSSSQIYIWKGKYSNSVENKAAPLVAKVLNPNAKVTTIDENSENESFWKDVGGKKTVFSQQMKITPKCFHFSNATGMVTAEPVWNFTQEDFTTDSVLLLDCNYIIYLWVGQKSRENDKKVAMETTIEYASQRKLSAVIINEGKETLGFVSQFPGWDGPTSNTEDSALVPVSEGFKEYSGVKTYSLEELKNKDKLPSSVDKANLEKYLSDEDFLQHFGMDKAAWEKLPSWKKGPVKKQLELF